jgi:hypothetical protein
MTIEAHPAQIDRAMCQARRRCEDQGVTVTFDPQAATAYTNGYGIVIPAIGMPITVDSLDTLYGQIIHETGHHLRDDAFKILKAAKPPEHLCALFNIAEDDGMERAQAKAHKGDAIALSKMNEVLIKLLDSKWREQAEALNGDPAPMACLALGHA